MMKKAHNWIFPALVIATTLTPISVFALAGEIESADVAYPESYPPESQAKVRAALQREDSQFMGGHFVNWFTTIMYTGDMLSLNLMIDNLTKCPDIVVTVRFQKVDAEHDWLIFHNALTNQFDVHVNLNSQNIDLEQLRLPPLKKQEENSE